MTWFRNYIRTVIDEHRKILIYGVEAEKPGQIPVPLAALATQLDGSSGGPRSLTSLSNYYTSLYGVVLDGRQTDYHDAIYMLVCGICNTPHRWDTIHLRPLDADSDVYGELISSFRNAGMVVQTYFCFGNWYLRVDGRSYRQYMDSLPSILKNTIARKTKKLEKTANTRFDIVTGNNGLEEAERAYTKIYAQSWKVPEPYPLFVPGLMRSCADRGWLRLGVAYVDSEPAAAQLWIVCAGKASIFKLAYDVRYSALSVGSILSTRLMEYVIDVDKVEEVDYLTGDDPYKRDWMSHRRERWGIMAFNPRTVQGIRGILRHVVGRSVKNVLEEAVERFRRRWTGASSTGMLAKANPGNNATIISQ
jgi:hypothetical protein